MKFNSKAGQELRTWILFFVGIGLAITFALNGNPLNPWWTLVIGAFTSTAVIVSAVQAVAGGIKDATHPTPKETGRVDSGPTPEEPNASPFSVTLGHRGLGFIRSIRSRHPAAVF